MLAGKTSPKGGGPCGWDKSGAFTRNKRTIQCKQQLFPFLFTCHISSLKDLNCLFEGTISFVITKHKTPVMPDVLVGKESVPFNMSNFVTNKVWQKSQDLSEDPHPQSLCFVTSTLDISCFSLHLSPRTFLPSGATRAAD